MVAFAGYFSLNVPSGLTLYWFVNNLLSTAQQVNPPLLHTPPHFRVKLMSMITSHPSTLQSEVHEHGTLNITSAVHKTQRH